MLHSGLDMAAPKGTPIYATAKGTVSRAQWVKGYGLYVRLMHGQFESGYGHMSRLNVVTGQRVDRGDIIGYVGSTGRSTGNHLHYEVRKNGLTVDPVKYLK